MKTIFSTFPSGCGDCLFIVILNSATLLQIKPFKYLSNKKLPRILPYEELTYLSVAKRKQANPTTDMAKIQIKPEKLTPFGGIYSIMEQFDST